jgi:NADPH:quinone reductase-like Zn-dependent oxidoreductase
LYKALGLPLPTDSKKDNQTIFIHGGSTATGIFGIQLAKLSGLKVITTASPHNFAYLKSLGADQVFDYKIPDIGAEIRSYTDNNLKVAWDCAGSAVELINSSLSSNGGRWGTITPYTEEQLKAVRPDIDGPYHTLAYEIFGEPFRKFKETPAKPDELEHAKTFWESTRQLLEEGKLKVPRIALNRGGNGLDCVLKGMDDLRAHRVSGEKLVYTL